MPPTQYHFDSLGLSLAYYIWEGPSPQAPTVLLLHGYLDHALSFIRVAETLSSYARVIALDHRGHGHSASIGTGGYYHFPDYVMDVANLLEHLQLEQVLLVGHSMGASIAVYFTGAFPEKVSKLALLDSIGPAAPPPERAPHLMRRWISDVRLSQVRGEVVMDNLDEVARKLARTSPLASHERLLEIAQTAARPLPEGGYRWNFDPLHRTTAPTPFEAQRFQAFLDAITCPTMVLWGERTPNRPADAQSRLSHLHQVDVRELKGAAHNLHHEQPDALSAELLDFLFNAKLA